MPARSLSTGTATGFLDGLAEGGIEVIDTDDAYTQTYSALLHMARQARNWNSVTAARALACATYGWMPTALKHPPKDGSLLTKAIGFTSVASARKWLSGEPEPEINNSWVGTSKFLHFLQPTLFPIWDSRIGYLFGLRNPAAVNTIDRYVEYFDFMHERQSTDQRTARLVRERLGKAAVEWSDLRCIEVALFAQGKMLASQDKAKRAS